MKRLVLFGGTLCLLAAVTLGCNTTYYVRVRTFPPAVGNVYIDDEFKGTTAAESGETTVISGKKSIFKGTVVSLLKDDMKGVYVMNYGTDDVAMSHVVSALGWNVGPDRRYSITYSFDDLHSRPTSAGAIEAGPNQLSIHNPNDVMVWVSLRGSGRGDDYIMGKNQTIIDPLPDGDYRMFLIYADAPDRLVEVEEAIHLDGGDASVEVPRRAVMLPPLSDSSFVGIWHHQLGSLTYSNYDHKMELTFPSEAWTVYTEPEGDMPWVGVTADDPSHHVLIAVLRSVGALMQVMITPMLGEAITLEEYQSFLYGSLEMLEGDDFRPIDSQVVQRKGQRMGVFFYELKAMKFMVVVFREEDWLVTLSFNAFEGVFESRLDEFWSIADSYKPAIAATDSRSQSSRSRLK